MQLEEMIQKHRPPAAQEGDPAEQQLIQLNRYGLLMKAVRVQLERDGHNPLDVVDHDVVVSKLTAWEVLAEAQRNGLRIEPFKRQPPRR